MKKEMEKKIKEFAAKMVTNPQYHYNEEDYSKIIDKINSAPQKGKTAQEVMAIIEVGGCNARQAALLMGLEYK